MNYININGNIESESNPAVPVWNRAFHYGDGLFETIAVHQHTIPLFDAHWERLSESAQTLFIELPPRLSKKILHDSILELIGLNKISGNARVRVSVFREGKGKYTPMDMQAGFVIEAEPLSGELFAFNEKGLSIDLYPEILKHPDRLANLKTANALIYVMASIHKTTKGIDDSLLLNTAARVCEATASNIFIVKDKSLLTPSLKEGCVNGVMRQKVIALAKESAIQVKEMKIEPEWLEQADEIFLTNAVAGIRWVGSYGDFQFGNKRSTELSEKLKSVVEKNKMM